MNKPTGTTLMSRTVNRCKFIPVGVLLIAALAVVSQGSVAVEVHSMEERMGDNNISIPRIYIKNTGTETINNFTYRYFFTTENGAAPTVEPYYIPNAQIMLVPTGSGYYVQYSVTDANLAPGGLLPNSSGNAVGLYYNDRTQWDKTNDFSNLQNSEFLINQNISVYLNGTKIYGNEPGTVSGSVMKELWTGISGTSTDNIDLNATPWLTTTQENLDGPVNIADNYGVRLRGYITAPVTGEYTFWLASDNNGKFWLSTDDDPANKGEPIASVPDWTDHQEWNKFGSQKSNPVSLVAGTRYYIEILHKEGTGGDNCAVGWAKPGQSTSAPSEVVPASVLSPFVPDVVPAVPGNLVATAVSSQRIDLSWTDASINETGFEIFMKIDGGGFESIGFVGSNTTTYIKNGLTPETQYQFKVRAYTTTRTSDFSNAVVASTFAVPEGTVTREVWEEIGGWGVGDIPVSQPADINDELTTLETPQQWKDYYGQRIRGYLIPQTTGSYYFWIASDDYSELWLSPDDQVNAKEKIASVSGYTGHNEWTKYPSQASNAISLVAGTRYYIEVLHKEGAEGDNLSVGWRLGTSGDPAVITGAYLSPYIIPTVPNAPDNCSATPLSATQVDVTWSDNSNNENGFQVERATGAGDFVLVGSSATNVAVVHDGGLTANTEYRYRVRAWNDIDNSAWSSIVTVTTLDQSNGIPPTAGLNSFAVYSTEKTDIRSESYFNGGGAAGSNKLVDIGSHAVVDGNVVCGDSVHIMSEATVTGSITAGGQITLDAGANVGETEENATVAQIVIPEIAAVPTGVDSVYVGLNHVRAPLSPGHYTSLKVDNGGTITFTAGQYTFTEFFLGTDAKIILDVGSSDMVDVQVEGYFELSDRSKVEFLNGGYVPFMRFYTNSTGMVRLGVQVVFNGTLTAPHGDIHVYSGTQCNGALYGKFITVEPGTVVNSGEVVNQCADNDGDKIANIIEILMGTDPDDASSFKPIAIPSEVCIDNTQEVTITYDFSVFYSEYSFATAMEAVFPAGALNRPYLPLIIQLKNSPEGIPEFSDPDRDPLGKYITFHSANGLANGMNFTLQTPHPSVLSTTEYLPYQYDGSSDWVQIPESSISGSDATSHTVTYTSTDPIIFAGERIFSDANKVLYFPGGYVYSNGVNSALRFNLGIGKFNEDLDSVAINVQYLDYSTNPNGVSVHFRKKMERKDNYYRCGTLFYYDGNMACPGTMKILETGFTFYPSTVADSFSCTYDCNPDMTVRTGQSLVMSSQYYADQYNPDNFPSPQTPPAPEDLISLSYYPGTETFESSNFGEGRITYTTTPGDPSPFTYEYYLTDHLGSTRMVINDEGYITEAVTYQPYGSMKPVGSIGTATIPVREKFTTKEFDEEGGADIANGVDGIKCYYFGARVYDPEVGVWGTVDPGEQYWNLYSYCGNKPGKLIDPSGRRGVLFHFITGGYYSAKADYYRYYDMEAHNYAHDRRKYSLADLDAMERPSRFSEEEWEGIKSHARADYYGHDDYRYGGGSAGPGSPIEAMIYNVAGPFPMNVYQDVREGIALGHLGYEIGIKPAVIGVTSLLFLVEPTTALTLLSTEIAADGVLEIAWSFTDPLAGLAFFDEGIALANYQGNLTFENAKSEFVQSTVEATVAPLVTSLDPTGISQVAWVASSFIKRLRRWFK
jgi:RHS repeat-associated protein